MAAGKPAIQRECERMPPIREHSEVGKIATAPLLPKPRLATYYSDEEERTRVVSEMFESAAPPTTMPSG